ncbi:MAG: radical SAM protein [Deltaproteobacteria bacterium]|nr:radical SAM protein [Deltaproteobacteria bacterium]
MNAYTKTKKKVLTRRGVLWLGQTCNLRCHFCYFLDRINSQDHPEHPFMTLDKAKYICHQLRYHYDNNAIDIQGGEPLLFKDIYKLISYCRQIGLYPTIITNGLLLAKKDVCEQLKDAGVRDLLLSVHGVGETYDQVVGVPGASKKQMEGLARCRELGIPIRFNTVLSKLALPQLTAIAQLAIDSQTRVVNFIAFNPFEDQSDQTKRSRENVPAYTEVAPPLTAALDLLEAAGVEANVRYLPLCIVPPRHRNSMYNFQQLPYDLHEWDYMSWSWTGEQPQRMRGGTCSPLISLKDSPGGIWIDKLKLMVADKLRHYPRLLSSIGSTYHRLRPLAHVERLFQEGGAVNFAKRDPALYRANARLRAEVHCRYLYSSKCPQCAGQPICDGFHGDYVSIFGADEADPMRGLPRIDDPCHFIQEQDKVIEEEDYGWVLGRE